MSNTSVKEKYFKRNLWTFSAGGFGRDFMYNLFNTQMYTFILLTKNLTDAEAAIIGVVIMVARIWDAVNDPLMGGIIENTRTRWGKFKPWIMLGAVTNSILVFFLFWVPLKGMEYVIFFGIAYILLDVTFTMNDIGYWSMLPALSSNPANRDMLSSVANIFAGVGGAIVGFVTPILTVGSLAIGGSAVKAYPVIAIIAAVLFIGCQTMTCICVKEDPLPPIPKVNGKRPNPLKQMFKVIKGNDQLLWVALTMVIYNLGSSIIGGLSNWFVYLRFGYAGAMTSLFGILSGIASVIIVIYPLLAKKFERKTIIKICMVCVVIGYGLMLLMGLVVNNFYLIALCGFFYSIGQTLFYQVLTISIANTVEYNEWKTGEREESIIFSVRPFMAKMGSALQMGVVSLVLGMLGITAITEAVSQQENWFTQGVITSETEKITNIENILAGAPESAKTGLLVCMTVIPIVLVCIAGVIYLTKYKITESKYEEICAEIRARKEAEITATEESEETPVEAVVEAE